MTSVSSTGDVDQALAFADVRAAEKAAELERNVLAAKTVAVYAQDAAECVDLLAMLGLDLAGLK